MPRLRRVDCGAPGITRRRRGKGFEYLDDEAASGSTIPRSSSGSGRSRSRRHGRTSGSAPTRSATSRRPGIDARGRKQYRYHDLWRERRDRQKFDDMIDFATSLPQLREQRARATCAGGASRASACSPAPSGCSTAGSSGSAPRTTRRRTRPTGWRPCASATSGQRGRGRLRLRGQGRQATGPGRSGTGRSPAWSRRSAAPARRRPRAARLSQRQRVARRPLARHQRLHQGRRSARPTQRQGLPHLERDGAGGRRRWPPRRGSAT